MAKIKTTTIVRNPRSGEVVVLNEGDTAPGWAADVITNPAVLDRPSPRPRSGRSDKDQPREPVEPSEK